MKLIRESRKQKEQMTMNAERKKIMLAKILRKITKVLLTSVMTGSVFTAVSVMNTSAADIWQAVMSGIWHIYGQVSLKYVLITTGIREATTHCYFITT